MENEKKTPDLDYYEEYHRLWNNMREAVNAWLEFADESILVIDPETNTPVAWIDEVTDKDVCGTTCDWWKPKKV